MKRIHSFSSIRSKIFVTFSLLLLFTCLCLFFIFVRSFTTTYNHQADSYMEDITELASSNVSAMIEQLDQLSVSVIVDNVVQENLYEINSINERKLSGAEARINDLSSGISNQIKNSVFNISGVISLRIYSLEDDEIFVGTSNREYLAYSQTKEQIFAAKGAALWSLAGEDNYLCLCRAILSTTNLRRLGYMVIVCRNDYFSGALQTVSSSYTSTVYLIDEANNVVTSNDPNMVGQPFPYGLAELREAKTDRIADPGTGENSNYYIGHTLENGWTLVTTVSSKQINDNIRRNTIEIGLILLTIFLISLFFTQRATHKLILPTQSLLEGMNRFGGGDLNSRVNIEGNDEISEIGTTYNHMADNIQNLMEKVYKLEITQKEAEIEFLKMQINPHFLYNTLDTISWMSFMNGNEDVSEISVLLAKLFRANIKRDSMNTVSEELEIIQDYLQIQHYRFGDKISVNFDIDPDPAIMKFYIPSFLLQPLVENCFTHGLEGQMEHGELTIALHQDEEWLRFSVSDNGMGMSEEQINTILTQCQDMNSGSSIGLKNVYRRLQLLCGTDCQFTIKSEIGKGTLISFRIPIINDKEGMKNES